MEFRDTKNTLTEKIVCDKAAKKKRGFKILIIKRASHHHHHTKLSEE
jgi:hypothetical protein